MTGQVVAVGREFLALGAEAVRIAAGRCDLQPQKGDRRFADPAWSDNAAYRRLLQSYFAGCRTADNLVANLEREHSPHAQVLRLAADVVTSALAPTNFLATNPAALKRAVDTGSMSLLRGLRNLARDAVGNGGMPSTAKRGALRVGEDLALTPGSVVARDEVAEVIRYHPTTDEVREIPTLVVPPPIGRYYFLDLAPGRSFVEYSVARGIQMFMLSWRNPSREQAHWNLATYAQRVQQAIDEVREVTGQDEVNLMGFCAGGIIATVALNDLAAREARQPASLSLAVTLLDWAGRDPLNALASSPVLSLVRWRTRRAGVIDARSLGAAFAWLRPNDLIWTFWVNNYLMGDDPPVFDILAWNDDGTNLPACLHLEFLDIFENNPLSIPGARSFLGAPVDLGRIVLPNFVVGAVNDHLTPWRGTYRSTELLGGESTYVLSNAGHIASLVNPPDNPKASYCAGPGAGELDAEAWRASAQEHRGSWWEAWAGWTAERAGDLVAAPVALGASDRPVLSEAPGLYVRDLEPT